MPARPLRRTARATAPMVDLLNGIADQGERVRDWEVTRQPEGVLLRVRSRECYGTEADAEDAAADLVGLVVPDGYEPVSAPVTSSRHEEVRGASAWRACVEMVLRRGQGPTLTAVPSNPQDEPGG